MVEKKVVGFVINAELEQNKQLRDLDSALIQKFGDAVWLQPSETRHITLMDWLAPFVDYGRDKDELFAEIISEYDAVLNDVLADQPPITVHFNEIKYSHTALFIVGEDGGAFNKIRETFLGRVSLIGGTKPPPTIVHSTLARFTQPPSPSELQTVIEANTISFEQTVNTFRLVRETRSPMLEYGVLKAYSLVL